MGGRCGCALVSKGSFCTLSAQPVAVDWSCAMFGDDWQYARAQHVGGQQSFRGPAWQSPRPLRPGASPCAEAGRAPPDTCLTPPIARATIHEWASKSPSTCCSEIPPAARQRCSHAHGRASIIVNPTPEAAPPFPLASPIQPASAPRHYNHGLDSRCADSPRPSRSHWWSKLTHQPTPFR
jgi:hypothetical protein